MGNNLFNVETADGKEMLLELPAQFRSTFWVKRGSYVVVDSQALAERDNKLNGEIANVVRDERAWRKMTYWYALYPLRILSDAYNFRPSQFSKKLQASSDSEDESRASEMPPPEPEDEEHPIP